MCFVRDLSSDTTTLASVNAAGTGSGNGASELPALSPDARWVVFQSRATDLVDPPVAAGGLGIYARDLSTQTIRRLLHGLRLRGCGEDRSSAPTAAGWR